MAGILGPRAIFWVFVVLAIGVIYRTYTHSFIFLTLGIGREIQPIEDFPWTCIRVRNFLLEGCEDLWLDEQDRKLPPVDYVTREFLDALVVGANSTVEMFDLDETSDTLEHIKSIASEAIFTPNGVAVEEDGLGFVITNDHNTKTRTFCDLEMLSGGGSLAYCRSNTGKYHIAADKGFSISNRIAHDKNSYYYVANSASGLITVHRLVNNELI
ncbi:calcium-dependent phosphotriesterase [Penicillium cinerascens]|uniref:Calcium-dependent phosphotriesterase n=1 Tax=Penicillium cinerascens TaxID=70096 RepID=A0A9W9MAP1_9EURO|nr:calcium-dependent phosphotriesterase [Penicillium cinerascens]KAJ5195490.1 calcium-dependent phosphotriesterase [Penicillium cinerascens]